MSAALKMPSPTEGALQQLSSQGFVQYHPILADKLGSFKAALFMGHALYWARHVQANYQSRDGWFFLSAKQCTEATGLSAREQASARQLLIEHSLLAEMVAGRPAKLHYKVDLKQVALFLGMAVDGGEAPTWQQLLPLFQGCINFYRPLATITGNVAAGLYLSHLLHQHRHFLSYPRQGAGFTVSQSALRTALCLGVKTQRNARDRLKQIGLLVEHGNLLQINLQALVALLQGQGSKPLKQSRKSHQAGPLDAAQAAPSLALVRPAEPVVNVAAAATDANTSRLFKSAAIPQKQLFGPHTVGSTQTPAPSATDSTSDAQDAAQALIVGALRGSGVKAGRLFGGHLAEKRQPAGAPALASACQTGAQNAKLELPVAQTANQLAESAKLTCPKRKTNLPKAQNIKVFNVLKTTTSAAQAPVDNFDPSASAQAACRRSSFDTESRNTQQPEAEGATLGDVQAMAMPAALQASWHDAVRRVLAKAKPEHRQQLLDELEGQLANPAKAINNPPGYLHSLRIAMESGLMALAHAETVAAQRSERERTARALQRHIQSNEQAATSKPSMTRAEALAKIRQQADEMRGAR